MPNVDEITKNLQNKKQVTSEVIKNAMEDQKEMDLVCELNKDNFEGAVVAALQTYEKYKTASDFDFKEFLYAMVKASFVRGYIVGVQASTNLK